MTPSPDPARASRATTSTCVTHQVLVVGGGPTGLMLAGELALAGIDVALVERRADQGVPGTRALGLYPRTMEVFDLRGIGDRFVAAGTTYPALNFHVPLDITDFPSRRNFLLGLAQNSTEQLLADWVDDLPVSLHRGKRAVALEQDERSVCVMLDDGTRIAADYVVGCDGGRSFVRKALGIAFNGWPASTSWIMAEARTETEPAWGFHVDASGAQHAIARTEAEGFARMVLVESRSDHEVDANFDDLKDALLRAYGTDFGVNSPVWISRFTDMARQAETYRKGRVLLAGDAAHVHAPLGGQGLGIGVQDAMNLGWKLAQVVKGSSPDSLLDTYQDERHPVAARVLQNTMALSALRRPDPHSKALAGYFTELLQMDEPRNYMAAELSGLGTRYNLGKGHPLLGSRMPDLEVIVDDEPTHVYALLHPARPLLLDFHGRTADITPWLPGIRAVAARPAQPIILPLTGRVSEPGSVLVRPDGYVAWTDQDEMNDLRSALDKWVGTPA